jgi:hypothetical protein
MRAVMPILHRLPNNLQNLKLKRLYSAPFSNCRSKHGRLPEFGLMVLHLRNVQGKHYENLRGFFREQNVQVFFYTASPSICAGYWMGFMM